MKLRLITLFVLLLLKLTSLEVFAQNVDSTITIKPFEVVENRWNIFTAGTKKQNLKSALFLDEPNANLADVLNQNSQVFVKSYGMGSLATTSFRGGSASHTAILWNGINISSPFNALIDMSLIPAGFMDEISINYGGAGGLWGSGAVGGAIHLRDNHQLNKGVSVEIGTSVGSFGSFSTFAKAGFSGKKSSHKIGFLGQSAENNFEYFNPYSNQNEVLNKAQLKNQAIYTSHELFINPKNHFSISAWFQNTNREIPPTFIEKNSKTNQADQSIKISSQYTKRFNKNLGLFVRGGYINEYLEYNDSIRSIHSYNYANKAAGEAELIFDKNQHALNFGLNGSFADALGENYLSQGNQKNMAAFIGYRFVTKNKKLNLSANVRQAQQNKKVVPLTYFLGADYKVFEWLKLYGNVARVYRLPAMNDLYWTPGGNSNLFAEDGFTEEFGFSIKIDEVFEKFSFENNTTIFNRNMQNWIAWVPNGAIWSPQNFLEVWSRGTETNTSISFKNNKLTARLNLNTSYVLSTNEKSNSANDASLGKQLIYVPLYTGNLNAEVGYDKFNLIYQQQYAGYRYTTTDNTQFLLPYNVSNLALGYKVTIKSLDFNTSFKINNLLNTNYQMVLNRPMPLRNYQISLIIKYHKK